LNTQFIRLGRIVPAVVVLAVVGAVLFSYYRRSLSFHDPSEHESKLLPENVTGVTEGFSFLQSEHGQARFEIKAKVHLGYKDKKNLLESVTVKVFGKDGNRHDTITSDHCEYDEDKRDIVFSGNVVIRLSHGDVAPEPAKVAPTPNDRLTTIQMEKITYLEASGKAQTDDLVRFVRGNMQGTSRGLTYDSNQGSVYLHSDVQIVVQPTDIRRAPVQLRCDTLDYLKASGKIDMRSNVSLLEGDRSLNANQLVAWLRETDSSISRIDAIGKVRTVSRDPSLLLKVDAEEMTYFFDGTGRWLDKVWARRDVKMASLDPAEKRELVAEAVDILLKPSTNLMSSLEARGNVILVMADRTTTRILRQDNPFPDFARDPRFDETSAPGDKRVKAPEMLVSLRDDGKQISQVQTTRQSLLEEFPLRPERDKTNLTAGTFNLFFAPDSDRIEKFMADDQVRVDVIARVAPVKTSTSDHLEAFFDADTRQLSQMRQFGNFHYREGDQDARASEAHYFAETRRTVLKGNPVVKDTTSRTSADGFEFEPAQNLVKARGNVRSVFETRDKNVQPGMFQSDKPVYASADFLEVQNKKGIATYRQKAKLWQEDQVIRASTLVLDRKEKRLVAETQVVSLFYLEEESAEKKVEKTERKPATIQAERLVYEDRLQKATYFRNVRMTSATGRMNSDQLEIFLKDENNRKSVERMLATGKVKIEQPGKLASSESAEFFQSEKKVVLTGGMPRVLDSERGSTVGPRLTMFFDDGSITVAGNPETRAITRQRVTQ
jgi:lipopolysaccharide export system protein LptA